MPVVSRSWFVALSVIVILAFPAFAQEEEAPPEADISVTKSGPPQANAGSDVTYTITIRNAGDVDAANVTLTDPLPAGMTFVSLTQSSGPLFSCTTPAAGDPGTVVCTRALLAVNETASFTLVAQIPADAEPGSFFVNIATGTTTTTDNTDENNSGVAATGTPPPPRADIGVMKHGPATAAPDANVTYTITITNSGPSAAQDVTYNDTLPGTMTFVSLVQTAGPPFSCTTPAMGAGGTITCSTATVAAGATATFTLTGHIPDDTPSGTSFDNQVTVQTTTLDPNEENNVSSTSLTVSSVDLSVTKSGPTAANAGENLTYTIVVANAGPDAAFGVTLSDTLPEGTTFVSLTQNNGPFTSCSTGTRPIDCTWEGFAAGASAQFTLVVRAGNITLAVNTVEVTTSGSFDVDATNDSDSVSTTITPQADLALTKDGPATVTAGTDATFTITVANHGASDATSVTVTDPIPANTTFVSASPGCSATETTVTCTQASLLAGASTSFTVTFRVSPAATGTIDNTATVTSTTADPNGANNQDTASATVSTSADLAVVKSGPANVTAGSNITWAITLTNSGPSNAANVALDDALPANATFISVSQESGPPFTCTAPPVQCTIALFPAAASATFTLVANVDPATTGTVDNTAVVTSPTADPVPANNQSTASTNVNASADLAVVKTGPADVTAGSNITWTIAVTNQGPSTAVNVALDDALPANTTFVSFTQDSGPAFACTAPPVHCTIASFTPAATSTFTLVATVSSAATGSIENTAVVTSATMDPAPANNTSTATALVEASADLAVTKDGPATVTAGNDATFTITVTNNGPSDATSVTVTDPIPANTTFVSASPGCSATETTVTCTQASLLAGASTSFTVTFRVSPAASGTIDNTATVTSTTPDPNGANNQDTASATVSTSADLAVVKSGPAAVTAGSNITWTIALTNSGPSNAANVALDDTLPPNATFVSFRQDSGPAFTCTAPPVHCTIASFPAAASATFTLVANVLPAATGTVDNTAVVTSPTADPVPANNQSAASTNVNPSADLAVVKTGPAGVTAGSNITWTIAVTNQGPSTAVNVALDDALPANTTFVSFMQNSGPAFACTAPPVHCTIASFPPAATSTFTLVATVSSAATGSIENTAVVTSATMDPVPANNTSTATAPIGATADLSVTKDGPATVTAGQDASYTVTVANAGPSDALNVTLNDPVPPNATFVSATQNSGPAFTCDATIQCTIASFPAGASATFTIVLRIDPAAFEPVMNVANVTSSTIDPTPGNAGATLATAVVAGPTDVRVVKSVSSPAPITGGTATFTIDVTNDGPGTALNSVVTDVLPAGTTFLSAEATQGSCSGTTTVTCTVGTLAPGQTETVTIVVTLPGLPTVVANTATVTAENTDPNPANNTSTAELTVQPGVAVPALSPLMLIALAAGLGMVAVFVQRT